VLKLSEFAIRTFSTGSAELRTFLNYLLPDIHMENMKGKEGAKLFLFLFL
jgi:hypothetical protein